VASPGGEPAQEGNEDDGKGAKVETRSFNGVRVVVHTSLTYDVVLGKLRSLMGASTVGEVVALAKKPITEAEFTREVEDRLVGESGFMPFAEIDHGGWLPKFGIEQRTMRLIIGNPLYAITMIRLDITAGLFAPVELLVTENIDWAGAKVTYVRPSSRMVVEDNLPLLAAAQALDGKLLELVAKATNV
jgi:uncharacterized protein (DUF302 family)